MAQWLPCKHESHLESDNLEVGQKRSLALSLTVVFQCCFKFSPTWIKHVLLMSLVMWRWNSESREDLTGRVLLQSCQMDSTDTLMTVYLKVAKIPKGQQMRSSCQSGDLEVCVSGLLVCWWSSAMEISRGRRMRFHSFSPPFFLQSYTRVIVSCATAAVTALTKL